MNLLEFQERFNEIRNKTLKVIDDLKEEGERILKEQTAEKKEMAK